MTQVAEAQRVTQEPTHVHTVRMPRSLHKEIQAAVYREQRNDPDFSGNKFHIKAARQLLKGPLDELIVKAVRSVVRLDSAQWTTLGRLLTAEVAAQADAKREIGETILELILPDEYIGGVAGQEAGKEVAASESSNRS